jgi:hypothetical protein
MKKVKWILSMAVSLSLIFVISIGCDHDLSVNNSSEDEKNLEINTFPFAKPAPPGDTNADSYPQSASHVYGYWSARDIYRGGTLNMPNGSFFQLIAGSLTPPESIPWGTNVEIFMEIDKNDTKNELIFTFGLSGCSFNPAGKVFLSYEHLDIDVPVLYYIDENGDYIEQSPDDIDLNQKSIVLYIDHFSRYAIGME